MRSVRAHELSRSIEADTPDVQGADATLPYGAFRRMLTEHWMMLTAKRGGEYVGITRVDRRPGDPQAVSVALTGVSPQARGQGVAAALKAEHAMLLAERGVQRIYTQNMDGNAPILATNTTMGFVPAGGYVAVHQPLRR